MLPPQGLLKRQKLVRFVPADKSIDRWLGKTDGVLRAPGSGAGVTEPATPLADFRTGLSDAQPQEFHGNGI